MDSLVQLVKSLRPGEVHLIQAYYKVKFSSTDNKRLQLLKLLQTDGVRENDDIARIIYNQKPNSTLSKLKERLKEDILNFILLFPPENLKVSLFIKAELLCRKLLLQGKILLARGILTEGIYLIKKAATIAEKYELIDVTIATNDTLRSSFGDNPDATLFRKINKKIIKAQKTYKDLLMAKELYQVLLQDHAGDAAGFMDRMTGLKDRLDRLRMRVEKTGSKRIAFWYLLASMRFYRNSNDPGKACECGMRLLEMIKSIPFLSTNAVAVAVRLELTNIYIESGAYQEARLHALTALDLCKKDSYSELQLLGALFNLYFKEQSYEEANQVARSIMNHPQLDKYKNLQARWQLYKSSLDFTVGNFKESIKRLNTLTKSVKDQKQYMVLVKYLELLNIIELGEYDWFEYKLESFRKYLGKINDDWVSRYKSIYKVFKALLSSNFNFNKVSTENVSMLDEISAANAPGQPHRLDYEMIGLREWLLGKIK